MRVMMAILMKMMMMDDGDDVITSFFSLDRKCECGSKTIKMETASSENR